MELMKIFNEYYVYLNTGYDMIVKELKLLKCVVIMLTLLQTFVKVRIQTDFNKLFFFFSGK